MKRNKIILFALLVGYLVVTSCTETRDPSKDIVYKFDTEFFFPDNTYSGKNTVLNMRIYSNVYRDEVLEHEGVYTDDKNSFLISPKGDTIKPGEKFSIPHIDKLSSFDFYSEDLGEHNLKFTFKNSKGFVDPKEHKLLVEKAPFRVKIKQSAQKVPIYTISLFMEYSLEAYDQLKHSYKMKFEVEENPEKMKALLNEHNPGEWFDISEISGKLRYEPLSVGFHVVKITIKNDMGVEKNTYFNVEVVGTEPIVDSSSYHFVIRGFRYTDRWNKVVLRQEDHRMLYKISFNLRSGNNTPELKGRFRLPGLGDIDQAFDCSPPSNPDGFINCVCENKNFRLDDNFYIPNGDHFSAEVYFENVEGGRTIRKLSIEPRLDYINYPRRCGIYHCE